MSSPLNNTEWDVCDNFETFRRQINHPGLHHIFDLWRSGRTGELPPTKETMDPTEIGAALANSFLYLFHPDHKRFQLRIAGENLADAHNNRFSKGKFLEALFPEEFAATTARRWTFCMETPAVMVIRRDIGDQTVVERIVAPVRDGDQMFLFGTSYYQNPQATKNPYRVDKISQFALALPLTLIPVVG